MVKKNLEHFLNRLNFNTKLFREFYAILKPTVEIEIKDQLNSCLQFQKNLNLILNDFSWQEWLETLDSFIEPLSIILITLIHDKILCTLLKLENSVYLNNFLFALKSEILDENTRTKGVNTRKNGFFYLFEDVWEKTTDLAPSIPILHPDNFSFNK